MSRPLSGWNAQIGDSAYRPVYETWVKEVNAQGGVFVKEYNKKLPIGSSSTTTRATWAPW